MPVKNICKCDDPPGGTVECEPDQLAICIVSNGVADRGCIDPPTALRDLSRLTPEQSLQYRNWALSHITGQVRGASDPLSNADTAILSEGSYRNEVTRHVITFRLPATLNLKSPSSVSGSGSSGSGGASNDSSNRQTNSGGALAGY